jgi:hypothetical protein
MTYNETQQSDFPHTPDSPPADIALLLFNSLCYEALKKQIKCYILISYSAYSIFIRYCQGII